MSAKDTGGPAFPEDEVVKNMGYDTSDRRPVKGMTLRDYFAAKALQGMLSHQECDYTPMISAAQKQAASDAYAMADAMLKARQS